MGISLVFHDSDAVYRNRLRAWTLVHPEMGFALLDMSEGMAGTIKGACIVLLGADSITVPEWVQVSRLPCVFLEEDGSDAEVLQQLASKLGRPIPAVKKYQPAPRLLEALRQVAETNGWYRPTSNDKASCRLTVLMHPGGGCHLEPVMPILAALCAKKAATALLSLDPVMETEFWYPSVNGGGLSRMAYEAKGVKGFAKSVLEGCLPRDEATGVRVARSADLPQDAAEFEADAIDTIRKMAGELGVEMLLVDGGAGFTERNLQLAVLADQLLFALSADLYGARVLEHALSLDQQLQLVGRGCWNQGQSVQWLFVGSRMPPLRCALPQKHAVRLLPAAYPDGVPGDPWAVSDPFLRSVHSLVPLCGGVRS